ncbi:MAG: choice-of-anchor D domain-containing protein, partial [bacterium]|nr:choice-of-anchor D domain-containing protein [Candidatus Minthenecus merdequi]
MKKVRILILSLMMAVSIAAAASSSVSLSSVQGPPRDTVTVVVDLSTTDAVSAVDITIPLGSYLKYAQNSAVLSSARSNGHVVSASQVGNNLRLLVYSLTLSALNGTNGELLRFDLVLGKEPGVYALTPQVILSNASGATISSTSTAGSVTILTPKIMLNTTEIDFGHIPIRSTYTRYLTISNTGTATLNVTGITFDDAELSCQQTYSIAAGSSQSVTINYAPQTHGAVTAKMTIASDATNGSQKVNIKADPFSVNELHLLNGSGIADDTIEVFMRMNNMENIVGMQSSFKMPESLVFIPNSFSVTPRGADHLAMASMSHDTLTLMAYSPTNTPFTGNDDTLCSFKVRLNGSSGYHYLTPFNVVLANAAGVNMMSATSNGYVYINSPRINVPSQLNMGNVSVTETKRVGLRINNYSNIDLKVGRVTFLAEGYNVTSQLPMTVQGYGYDTLLVEYNPTVEGSFSTTMQIYSNDPISRMTSVNVYGTAFEPNEFNLKGRCLDDGRYALTVGLDNYSDIVALQMDIHWLAGMNTNSSALTLKTRANGMLPMISQMSNGVYRVAVFSMNNIPLLDHSGEVFQLIYDGESDYNHSNIIIDNLIASDKKGVNKISKENGEFYVDLKEITVSCDNTRGVTSGGGIYNVGDTALLTASAFEDYHFVGWSNDSTSDSLYIVVNGDLSLTARFGHNPYLFQEFDTICQNTDYTWHNRQLSETGIYYDSLKTSEDVDSVYELTLTVNPTYFFPETYSICQGETYNWRNKALSTAGVYYDSLQTTVGCDSVYELTLTVNPTYLFPETYSTCQGETYTWRNKVLSTAGVYYDSLKTTIGCDSVYELTLTVNPTYLFPETYSICQGETYNWRSKSLSTAGVYYDSLQTTVGCDSVYELTLTVNPTYLFQETYSICQGETYNWRNKALSTAGVYYDSLQTIVGCDSVYELTLTVNPTYLFPETYSICQGETYTWRNKVLSTAGVYYDSLQTTVGCDSVYELTLTVNPTYLIQETYSICQGETYHWRNKSLSAASVYYDSLKTAVGCDSIYKLTLLVNSTYLIQQTVKWPSSKGNYIWRGKTIASTGIYYDSLKTISYCDSVYKLTIQFADDYLFTEYVSICQGEQYSWRGNDYGEAGIYYDSLRTVDGILDSVYELTLKVNPTYFFPETHSICQGETYNWRNKSLSVAGVYYDSLKTTVGCDSIYELTLTVNPTYFFPETYSICQGETYNWRNKALSTAGVYYDSLQTTVGCDSVYELTLTVNPTYFFPETYSICQGETYNWRNKVLSTAGVYYDSLQTQASCDSVYELTMTVNPTYFFPETYSICQGETYTWRNKVLSTAGVYYDSLQTQAS